MIIRVEARLPGGQSLDGETDHVVVQGVRSKVWLVTSPTELSQVPEKKGEERKVTINKRLDDETSNPGRRKDRIQRDRSRPLARPQLSQPQLNNGVRCGALIT